MKKCCMIVCLIMILISGVNAQEYNEETIITEQMEASGVYDIKTDGTQEIAPDFDFGDEAVKITKGKGQSPFDIMKNAVTMLFSAYPAQAY